MTTYAQVLLKKDLIVSLAKQFGFTDAIKIHYELPYEGESKIELRFIVTQARDYFSYENRSLLAGKLSDELGCDVSVISQEGIDNLYTYDYNRKSALVTDERALKEVIYKINNGISKEENVDSNEVNLINFEDVECKKIEGEYDLSLQRGLLREANKYLEILKKNTEQRHPSNVSSEAYSRNSLLPPEKKHKHDKDNVNPDGCNESDKKKLRSASESESREIPSGTPSLRKSS